MVCAPCADGQGVGEALSDVIMQSKARGTISRWAGLTAVVLENRGAVSETVGADPICRLGSFRMIAGVSFADPIDMSVSCVARAIRGVFDKSL